MADESLSPTSGSGGDGTEDLSLTGFRRAHFRRVLEACGSNYDEAARLLGVSSDEIRRELEVAGGEDGA